MDTVTDAVIWLMRQNNFTVTIAESGETVKVTATHPTEGTQTAEGTEVYATLCDVAEKCGFELDDG